MVSGPGGEMAQRRACSRGSHASAHPPRDLARICRRVREGSQVEGWAVGLTAQTDGGALALIEHFNGITWSSLA
jgi:hypothetical protein